MPLLTELAEIVVGSGSYKHAAPTELCEPCGSCGYKLRRTPRELTRARVLRQHWAAYGFAER